MNWHPQSETLNHALWTERGSFPASVLNLRGAIQAVGVISEVICLLLLLDCIWTSFVILYLDWDFGARDWSLALITGDREWLGAIRCRWLVAILHSERPLGFIQGVQRVRHCCTPCSEQLQWWRCSVLRPLLICNPALWRIQEAHRPFEVIHNYSC